jgi:hypothetical protein
VNPEPSAEAVPDSAIEAAARELAMPGAPSPVGTTRGGFRIELEDRARAILLAAYPAILADLRERLLSDEAVEAVARLHYGGPKESWDYVDGEGREWGLEDARRCVEAALDTLDVEEESDG